MSAPTGSKAPTRRRLEVLLSTLRREADTLVREPETTRVHLHNMLVIDEGDDAARLLERARTALVGTPWLRLRNRPDPGPGRAARVSALDHHERVTSLAWTGDGRLTFGDRRGALHTWDPLSGRLERLDLDVSAEGGPLAWSVDGRHLGFVDPDGFARVWDAAAGSVVGPPDDEVRAEILAWSPDGSTLVAGAGQTIRLWSVASGWEPTVFEDAGPVDALGWSPDGTRLASAGYRVKVWSRSTGTCETTHDVEVSPHPSHLVWTTDGGIVVGWSTAVGHAWASTSPSERIDLPEHTGSFDAVACSGDGAVLAYATGHWGDDHGPGDLVVRLWDRAARSVVAAFPWAERLAWAPDRRMLAAAWGRSVTVWDAGRIGSVEGAEGHTQTVGRVAWSPDGSSLASVGRDPRELRVWDGSTGALRWSREDWDRMPTADRLSWSPRSGEPTLGSWSPDGRLLASGQGGFELTVRDEEVRGELGRWKLPAVIGDLAWSPAGSLLAVGSFHSDPDFTEHHVRLWSRRANEVIAALEGHREPVERLGWSPTGDRLASADRDGVVRVWAISAAGDRPPRGHGSVITGSAVTGRRVMGLAWSPDGGMLAVGDERGVLRLWNALAEEWGPDLWARCDALRWSHDGTLLATGGSDSCVRVWDRSGGCIAVAHCLSWVDALQWGVEDATVLAADDGAVSGNRPLPYLFELTGFGRSLDEGGGDDGS